MFKKNLLILSTLVFSLHSMEKDDYSLIKAAMSGNLDAAKKAISRNVPIDLQDNNGSTALMFAVRAKTPSDYPVIAMHFGRGAVVSTMLAQSMQSSEANNGKENIIKLLLSKGAKLHLKDKNGNTALHHATFKGKSDFISLLINAGAGVNDKNINGITPLMIASSYGDLKTVQIMINAGARVDEQDNSDRSAIMFAAKNNHLPVILELIKHGADVNEAIIKFPKYEKEMVKALQIRDLFKMIERGDISTDEYAKDIPSSATNHNGETVADLKRRLDRTKSLFNYQTFK